MVFEVPGHEHGWHAQGWLCLHPMRFNKPANTVCKRRCQDSGSKTGWCKYGSPIIPFVGDGIHYMTQVVVQGENFHLAW